MKHNRLTLSLITILTASLIGLGKHAYLGSFSRFMADDYCSAAEAMKLGIFRAAWYWYITWNGRYSANLLDAIFGKFGPNFTPVVTLLVLITWLAALGIAIFQFLPKSENRKHLLISAALATTILFLTLTLAPNVRQSLYWSQGMRSVVPPLILGTWFICLIQWSQGRKWSRKSFILWLSLSMIVCFTAGGFSETYTVFQLSVFLLVFGIFLINKKYIFQKEAFYFLISGFLGAAISLFTVIKAPGNHFRQFYFPLPPALPILMSIAIKSFWLFFIRMFSSTENILGLAGAIVIGGLVSTLFDSKSVITKKPFLIMVIGLGLVFSCFPPSAYGLSDAPPDRALIIPTYCLVLTLVIFGFSLGYLLSQRYQINHIVLVVSLLLIPVLGAISIYQTISTKQIFINYAAAWGKFHSEMLSYQQAGIKNVEISTQDLNFNNWAELDVLGDNSKFWVNECISDYYRVKVISNAPRP